jgi:hypothetical protein
MYCQTSLSRRLFNRSHSMRTLLTYGTSTVGRCEVRRQVPWSTTYLPSPETRKSFWSVVICLPRTETVSRRINAAARVTIRIRLTAVQRWASGAAGSGSAADAVGSRVTVDEGIASPASAATPCMRVSPAHGSSHVPCWSCRPSALARRLRHVGVPMEHLPVRVRLSSTDCAWDEVIHVQHVVGLDRTSAVAALSRLPLQPRGDARGDARIMPPSCAPIPRSAIRGAAPGLHLHRPADRPLDVGRAPPPSPSRGTVPSAVFTPPVPLLAPFPVLVRMPNPAPRPPRLAPRVVHRRQGLLATDR